MQSILFAQQTSFSVSKVINKHETEWILGISVRNNVFHWELENPGGPKSSSTTAMGYTWEGHGCVSFFILTSQFSA